MGGGQTLNIAIPNLDTFAYVGVFSAGLSGGGAGQPSAAAAFETQHRAALDNAALKPGLKLLWFSTGREDRALPNTTNAVNLLRRHGFAPVFEESAGGHTWENWRDYLVTFSGQLFR
jgi:enterochelin esterase family protein